MSNGVIGAIVADTIIDAAIRAQNRNAVIAASTPTIASVPRGTPVLNAITYADPNAATAIVRQAAQRMLMLSMMGNVTSPAGIRGIMAGSLGGMFSNLINQFGIAPVVGMLNSVLPGIGSALGNTLNYALNVAISKAMSGQKAGVYSSTSVAAAAATTASIAAINAATVATTDLTVKAATLGGTTLGLDSSSLAAIIASSAVGSNISQTVIVDGSRIDLNVFVASNEIQLSLPNSPTLTGNEHIALADLTTTSLTQAILKEIALAGSPQQLSQKQFVNVVQSNYNNVQNNGLQMILGYGINQLLNNALSLVFSGSGNMYNPPVDLYFRSLANPAYITQSRIQSIKNIALSRVAYNTANMFLNSPYSSNANIALGLVNQVSRLATGQSLQMNVQGLIFNAINRGKI